MQCGGFRTSYSSDERIFDTVVPIIGGVALIAVAWVLFGVAFLLPSAMLGLLCGGVGARFARFAGPAGRERVRVLLEDRP